MPRSSAGTTISTVTTQAANDLIKKDNPEMTDEQLAFSIKTMKEYGIVDSGDTLDKGIGCMTDEHFKSFYDKMVKAGVVKAGLDLAKAYSTQVRLQGRRHGPEEVRVCRSASDSRFRDRYGRSRNGFPLV